MRKRAFVMVVLLTTLVPCRARAESDGDASKSTLVDSLNSFAVDLYHELRQTQGNIVISPATISTALAMSCSGARDNTSRELAEALHSNLSRGEMDRAFKELEKDIHDSKNHFSFIFRPANAMFGAAGGGYNSRYTDGTLDGVYQAWFEELDFAADPESARKTVNKRIFTRTLSKIENFAPKGSVARNTRLLLANGAYFKGKWGKAFPMRNTGPATFHVSPGKSIKVDMMRQSGVFYYRQGRIMQTLDLPFYNDRASMIIFLPNASNGLAGVEDAMKPEYAKKWMTGVKRQEVTVYLPKFDVASSSLSLKPALNELGVKRAFRSGSAEFSGINGASNLYLADMMHKSRIAVGEAGGSQVIERDATYPIGDSVAVFRVNHPFIFIVRDNRTGRILMLGRVVEPTSRKSFLDWLF